MSAPHEADYTPEIVDRWLSQWDLLVSLAESPRTSVHMLRFGHGDRHGSCNDGPRIPGGRPNDGLTWALIMADLVDAANRLPIGSLERRVVHARIANAGSLHHVATICRTRYRTVREAYQSAIVMMAELLGWVDDGHADVSEEHHETISGTTQADGSDR